MSGVTIDVDKRVSEEPALLVLPGITQVAAGAGEIKIGHPIEFEVKHLMDVARNHILHAILFHELMKRDLRVADKNGKKPGRPVRDYKLHFRAGMGRQIIFEEVQL